MKIVNALSCILILSLLFISSSLHAEKELKYVNQVYDFGHLGIDFRVFHTFKAVNISNKTVTITDVQPSCDCSNIHLSDSLIEPGDTAFFKLDFDTKNLYGPTSKSFSVFTGNSEEPEIKFFTLAIVGQWFNGIKPNTISIFFLPGKKTQKVNIPNLVYDQIKISDWSQFDNSFSTNIIKDVALKGEFLELEFSPNENLEKGTYQSNITISVSKDDDEPTMLTIPVKIVQY